MLFVFQKEAERQHVPRKAAEATAFPNLGKWLNHGVNTGSMGSSVDSRTRVGAGAPRTLEPAPWTFSWYSVPTLL